MSIGPPEIVLLFVLALLLFGPKKLPEVGRAVGQAMRELKRMSSEVTTAFEEAMEERPRHGSSDWDRTETPEVTPDSAGTDDPYAPYRDAEEMAVGDEEDWMRPSEGELPEDSGDAFSPEGAEEAPADDQLTAETEEAGEPLPEGSA